MMFGKRKLHAQQNTMRPFYAAHVRGAICKNFTVYTRTTREHLLHRGTTDRPRPLTSSTYDRQIFKFTALDHSGHVAQATAATALDTEKADASESEELQIKLVDKMQAVTSPVEAAAIGGGAGESLDATTTSQLEEAGAALDLAQRRALLLGRTKQRHVCLQCGRECPSKHKLKRHLSTHSEQRPYNCPLCGKSFKWTEYLAKHMRTQHPGVEGKVRLVVESNGH